MALTARPAGRSAAGARSAHLADPEVLGRIQNLELLARTVVDGFIQGLHRSPYLGLSIDFAEHRAYMPGDDIRNLDWKLYARTDRFYVKRFEAETNANLVVVLDTSASMGFASGSLSKLRYGAILGACLATLSRRQGDRVGGALVGGELRDYVPAAAGHLELVLAALDRAGPEGGGSFAYAVDAVAARLRRRGILVVISDFYEETERLGASLKRLATGGHDVIAFHVLDGAELDLPYDRPTRFEDLESGAQRQIVPEEFRDRYQQLMSAHTERLREELTGGRIDYELVRTDRPIGEALFQYLTARQRFMRLR
ncbi:MAG: DUF58 domain-containing protein [Gemmatimonadota bacterium]